eukprot:SAG31_NODE_2889_length_4948_cov_1.893586_4_plen_133_part_00
MGTGVWNTATIDAGNADHLSYRTISTPPYFIKESSTGDIKRSDIETMMTQIEGKRASNPGYELTKYEKALMTRRRETCMRDYGTAKNPLLVEENKGDVRPQPMESFSLKVFFLLVKLLFCWLVLAVTVNLLK